MKNLTTLTIVIFLSATVFSFFLGRYSVYMSIVDPAEKVIEKHLDDKEVLIGTVLGSNSDGKKGENLVVEEKEKVEEKQDNVAANPETKLDRTIKGISDKKIGEVLSEIAQNLEAKKLVYSSKLMQDCSGIFHQMKDSIQKRIPALATNGGAYQYPSLTVRSSRQIADWYHKNENLLIVEDAIASRNSIRPGSVLFYGKPNKKFENITIDMLTDRNNNYTSNGAIMHIAVVTAITTDAQGNVVDYTIMHGRNSRNFASRTGSKAVQSTNTPGLPPFGNWSQQLVAIANIATPAS